MPLQTALVEISVGGVWTDVSAYVSAARDSIRITRGRQDEQGRLEASKATFSLNNRDGRFSPRNPTGPYWGRIGRNTPVRISIPGYGYRFHGEISEWPAAWDYSGQDAWSKVEAAGITRRLAQGAPALAGPIERYMTSGSASAVAYWPMTDPEGSTTLAAGVGAYAMTQEGTTLPRLGANNDFSTSPGIPTMNSGSFRGGVAGYAGGTYVHFLLSVPAAGDTNDAVVLRLLTTGSAYRWELRYFTAGGVLQLRCYDNAGGTLLTSVNFGAVNGTPVLVRVAFVQSGGNVAWYARTVSYATGEAVGGTPSGTLAGQTAGIVEQVQINADRALTETAVGQLSIANADPWPGVVDAYRGYAGEAAGVRISRLLTAEGIPFTSVGDLAATEPMGPQRALPLLDVLAECEAADMGYLYEPRDTFGLAYRTRGSLYNQTPTATIPYTSVRDLQPVEDDQRTRNDITVTREGGSSARAVLTTGALSVLSPPNGVGRYQDAVTLNLAADSQLQYQAQWRLALGTLDEPRYPVIGVDILAFLPAAKAEAAAVDVGDLLAVTGTPIWVPPGGISTLALGYSETVGPSTWGLDFNCIPGSLFDDVFALDTGRLDTSTMVTNEPLDEVETGVDYTGEAFITTATHPGEFPVDVLIGGEQMTVTAATATTLTVVRSVNGVVKTHPTATPIRLANPAVLAL
jgi:hypothetical protein